MSNPKFKVKNIVYVYATDENKKFIQKLSNQYNMSESDIVNQMMEATRENKKLNLKLVIPSYVKKAEEWTKKHLKKNPDSDEK